VGAAVSWWVAVLAWIGLANGLTAAVTALVGLNRVLRPLHEIERYAGDTHAAVGGIERNLGGVEEALRTRDLVAGLRRAIGGEA
jgi:hypothetical protein